MADKKKCGHESVCADCTRAEIAKLEEKLSELKSKLPQVQTVVIKTGCGCNHHYCNHYSYTTLDNGIVYTFADSTTNKWNTINLSSNLRTDGLNNLLQ